MRRFAALYAELDASTATEAKLAALQRYLVDAAPARSEERRVGKECVP